MKKVRSFRVVMYEHSGRGGLFRYCAELSSALVKFGCNVSLISTNDCLTGGSNVEIVAALTPMIGRVWYLRYRPLWAVDRLYRAWLNSHKRAVICNGMNPDVVHLQLTVPFVDQFYVPRLSKKFRVVLTVHDVRRHRVDDVNNRHLFLKRIYLNVHHLIVHTRANKKQLIDEFNVSPTRVSVISHGVRPLTVWDKERSDARDVLNVPKSVPLILFFGTIRANKGLDLLLYAMRSLVRENPEIRLVVAGGIPLGDKFDKYSRIIDDFNLNENVVAMLRWIEESEVGFFFTAADVVVLPYTYFYSQSGVLLQAYRHGKPVVVTDVGGLGEVVNDDKTGVVVDATSEGVSNGVLRLLNDAGLYERCSNNMLKAVTAKYSWDMVAKRTAEVYGQVIR